MVRESQASGSVSKRAEVGLNQLFKDSWLQQDEILTDTGFAFGVTLSSTFQLSPPQTRYPLVGGLDPFFLGVCLYFSSF